MSILVKNLPANARDARAVGSVPGLGRSPGVENGNPLQRSLAGYSPLSHKELDTTECTHTHTFVCWLLWVFVAVCRLSLVECRLLIVVTSRCRADSRVHGLQ